MRTCRGTEWLAAYRELRRKVAVFKRKGWRPLNPDCEPGGLFTRELLVSADGKWVAKFAEVDLKEDRDAWSVHYAPFCHDVYNGKAPIDPRARPLIPRMPLYRRGVHITVAVIERLHPLPGENDARTDSELQAFNRYNAAREACWDRSAFSKLPGAVGLALRAMRAAIGSMPDDLHDKNVMVRRGPRGGRPVLVFTDPYGYVRA